ncbi:MAG: flagellar biosynthetic protein FliO [Aquincola sp.]|nr:flagellar biosynthetic protein FliO [Aquincola sp.]MDH4289581.1 flagellar biosynthetic protein FliO [Aquincola sp.]MDH5331772.1 flagellar biosynthetic protein FliO [Aquincola sp.]
MTFGSALSSLLWFVAILALIPVALWLLRRTPAGGAASQGVMRTVAVMPLSPSQRLVTVEVGRGEGRRWLVLGVTGQQITTLHEMAPQDDAMSPSDPQPVTPFAHWLGRMHMPRKDGPDAR